VPGVSGLVQAAGCGSAQVLRTYVAAGGALCLSGVGVVGALTPRDDGAGDCRAADNAAGPDIVPGGGSFLSDFLSLGTSGFRRAGPGGTADRLTAAQVTGAAAAAGFPTVPVDAALFTGTGGGLGGYDAALDTPGFVVGLDTLYTAGVAGAESPFQGKPIAWGWHYAYSIPARGPVALFGFPLEGLTTRAPGASAGHDLEALLSALAAWFRERGAVRS
jgi:hypothetical protein